MKLDDVQVCIGNISEYFIHWIQQEYKDSYLIKGKKKILIERMIDRGLYEMIGEKFDRKFLDAEIIAYEIINKIYKYSATNVHGTYKVSVQSVSRPKDIRSMHVHLKPKVTIDFLTIHDQDFIKNS